MSPSQQRFRQLHLDFHTSEVCLDVAADFDAEAFAERIQAAGINSANIFAKCCHGYSYYPTQIGIVHPHLQQPDLLGLQMAALHKRGIRCPFYLSIMWDDAYARCQPGSVVVDKDGRLIMRPPLSRDSVLLSERGWSLLDVTTEYGTYTLAMVEELCQRYPLDGFWFDICLVAPNYSPRSQVQMQAAGVDLEDDAAVIAYTRAQLHAYLGKLSDLVHSYHPDASIFYNGTTDASMGQVDPVMTHFELESVPTSAGKWGYLHYPISARHARTYGRDIVGMTVAFHKEWADFGGVKTCDQLAYECGTIVAAGGRISIGDQMHPRGVLSQATYDLIGHAYHRVAALEPWLTGTTAPADIGVLLDRVDVVSDGLVKADYTPDLEGFAQYCLERGLQFDIVDTGHTSARLERYPVLYVPESLDLTAGLRDRLETYMAGGGRLIVSGRAGLDQETGQFAFADFPAVYQGPVPTTPAYLRPDTYLAEGSALSPEFDYVFYEQAYCVQPAAGATAHGDIRRALFNRSWRHYTSHGHAPVGESLAAPVVVSNARILYIAAPLFRAYRNHDYWAYRALADSALRDFLPEPLLRLKAPGWIEASLQQQPHSADRPMRQIVHLVAYHPRRTMQPIQHVDQSWATAGIQLQVRAGNATSVYLAPEQTPLDFCQVDGWTIIDLPPVGAHTVVVIE